MAARVVCLVSTQADSSKKDKSRFQLEMKQQKLLEKEVSITGSNGFVRDSLDVHQKPQFKNHGTRLLFFLDLYKIYY